MFAFCSLGKELPLDSVADVLNGIDMSDNVENTFNSTSSPQCDEMNDILRNENDESFVDEEENTTTLIAKEISVVGSLLNQVTLTSFAALLISSQCNDLIFFIVVASYPINIVRCRNQW